MASGDVDAPEEVLEGHRSRVQRLSDRWLVSLLMVLVVVTAGAIAAAVHYRADAATSRKAVAAAAAATPPAGFRPPNRQFSQSVTVANSRLPVGRGQHALLAIVHSNAGAPRPLIITVQLLHLHPGRDYSLIGNRCESNEPDFVWATGTASKTGSLLLVTFPRIINPADKYWLALRQPGREGLAGVVGAFAAGDAVPFQPGHEPCAG